ncbi:MAG: hypothetical protein NC548_52495 [Lachnospiraceae bacterium]|nr:hypothetical protein [Lachnospiraceae bacterium]
MADMIGQKTMLWGFCWHCEYYYRRWSFALAGFAKAFPIEIIKRTAPLLLIAMIVNILVAFYLAKTNPLPPQKEQIQIESRF